MITICFSIAPSPSQKWGVTLRVPVLCCSVYLWYKCLWCQCKCMFFLSFFFVLFYILHEPLGKAIAFAWITFSFFQTFLQGCNQVTYNPNLLFVSTLHSYRQLWYLSQDSCITKMDSVSSVVCFDNGQLIHRGIHRSIKWGCIVLDSLSDHNQIDYKWGEGLSRAKMSLSFKRKKEHGGGTQKKGVGLLNISLSQLWLCRLPLANMFSCLL